MENGNLTPLASAIIAIVATLLGVVVGGFVSYWVSIALDNRARKARTAIRRKAKLYTPLRRELLGLEEELEQNKDSIHQIQTDYSLGSVSSFTLWDEMKEDGRSTSVSGRVWGAMESLVGHIENYNHATEGAESVLLPLVEPFQKKWYGPQFHASISGYGLASALFSERPRGRDHPGAMFLSVDVNASPEDRARRDGIADELMQAVNESQSFDEAREKYLVARAALLRQIESAIRILERAMTKIGEKYEKESRED